MGGKGGKESLGWFIEIDEEADAGRRESEATKVTGVGG